MPSPTIPKLRIPLQMQNGRLALVEQDSADNVAACVFAILAYERGSRIEDPNFGVESLVFDQWPLDLSEWLEQIARYEPRASIETEQEISEALGRIGVKVGTGG